MSIENRLEQGRDVLSGAIIIDAKNMEALQKAADKCGVDLRGIVNPGSYIASGNENTREPHNQYNGATPKREITSVGRSGLTMIREGQLGVRIGTEVFGEKFGQLVDNFDVRSHQDHADRK